MNKYLFDIEDISEEAQRRQIQCARSFTFNALRSNFDAPVSIGFSFGKDSLLTTLIAKECLEQLRDKRRVNLNFMNFGYEKDSFYKWYNYVVPNMHKRFHFRILHLAPGWRLSVLLLGRGRIPIIPSQFRWCTALKGQCLKILNDLTGKDSIILTGTRKYESRARLKEYEEHGFMHYGHYRTISEVDTTATWNYLKEHLCDLGLDYERLLEYYGNDHRDGCWFCYAQRYPKAVDLKSAITLKLRSYMDNDGVGHPFPVRLRIRPEILRTSLAVCKQWYKDLIQLQEEYGEELLTETDKKYIFELWNYRETREDVITQKGFLRDYFSGDYKPLYPELFDLTFKKKGDKYVYRYCELEEDGKRIPL